MLAKPAINTNGTDGSGCVGCPFAGDMKGFVPDEIREDAEVLVMAQNPGEDEERGRRVVSFDYGQPSYESCPPAPLTGRTGYAMERGYFNVAGLERKDTSLGNTFRCRYRHTNYLPPLKRPEVQKAANHCLNAHFKKPWGCKLIVAQGEYSLWAMTQEGMQKDRSISDWRGYVLPFQPISGYKTEPQFVWTPGEGEPIPVLAVNHIAMLFKSPNGTILAKSDWSKIPRILNGTWPVKPPDILIVPPNVWPREFAFDTEFIPETKYLIRYSMANLPPGLKKIIVRVVERENTVLTPSVESPVLVHRPKLITQNALADIHFFQELASVRREEFDLEDIMHIHAVLWAGLPHDLNTFGSLYSTINRWKHLERINPIQYSGYDSHGTLEAHWHMQRELDRDPASKKIYYDIQLKLVDVIARSAMFLGIKVNQKKSLDYVGQYKTKVDDLYLKAQAIAGWPINVGSNDQTKEQLYAVEKIQELTFPKPKPTTGR